MTVSYVTKEQVNKAKLIAGTGPVDVLFAMGLIELVAEEDPVKLTVKVAELERVNKVIEEMARTYAETAEYYRGICQQIGQTIGEDAYVADDGSKMDDVLVAKLPELVRDLKGTLEFERKGIARLQAELKQARKDRDHWHRAYQGAIEPIWTEKP